MTQYSDSLKVKDALQIYFSQYHFKDGGYNDKFFKIKIAGPFYFPLPNIKARIDAVKIHDIHHLVTGYTAKYRGEAQIGAREIASGCGNYWVAWILNLGSFIIGMLFYQKPLYKAFMDGRHIKANLYQNEIYNDVLLNKTVDELRKEIFQVKNIKNSFKDYFLFIFWCIASVAFHFVLGYAFIFMTNKLVSHLF